MFTEHSGENENTSDIEDQISTIVLGLLECCDTLIHTQWKRNIQEDEESLQKEPPVVKTLRVIDQILREYGKFYRGSEAIRQNSLK